MYKESWGLKRICPCNRIMYYDLGRKDLECPECGKFIEVTTLLSCFDLFQITIDVERRLHRQSKGNQDPRTIDLDILFFNQDIIADDDTLTELNKLQKYQEGIERNMMKAEKEIEFYEQNDMCGTCNQELSEDHKTKMISEHHGVMHQNGNALLELSNKIKVLKGRLTEVTNIQTAISTHQNQIQAINSYITKLKDQIKTIEDREDDIDEKIKKLKDLKSELKSCQEKQENLSNQKQLFETAMVLLKDTGIKTRIIKQYLPIMNTLINKYLASMDFFVSFNLDEKFEEKIKSRHRDEFTYDSFSEGEKMRIDLALLFTWRTIAKMKNSVNTNLLILDEVFDSSLDTNGTDEFLKILNHLTGKQNVFIISHKGDVLFDKFKDIIKFEKYKNFSRIV